MKNIKALSVICTMLFLISIVASFFGFLNQGNGFLKLILIVVSLIYLFSGWYFLKGYYPEGHPLVLFLMGYLYAGVFMAFAFVTAMWPLDKSMLAAAIAWSLIQMAMVTVVRKKIPREGFIQMLIESGIMLIMVLSAFIHLY